MTIASFASVVAFIVLVAVGSKVWIILAPPIRTSLHCAGQCRWQSDCSSRAANSRLLVFRAAAALWIFSVLFNPFTLKLHSFCFFTVWSWALLGVYFVFAALASARLAAQHRSLATSSDADPGAGESMTHSRLARCNQVLLSTVAAAVVLVDVTLWTILYPTDTSPGHDKILNFTSYNEHALNAVLLLTELAASRLTLRMHDLCLAGPYLLLYTVFTILRVAIPDSTRGCLIEYSDTECSEEQGIVWPYFFLDTSRNGAVLWYISLSAFYALAYCSIVLLRGCLLGSPASVSGRRSDDTLMEAR